MFQVVSATRLGLRYTPLTKLFPSINHTETEPSSRRQGMSVVPSLLKSPVLTGFQAVSGTRLGLSKVPLIKFVPFLNHTETEPSSRLQKMSVLPSLLKSAQGALLLIFSVILLDELL